MILSAKIALLIVLSAFPSAARTLPSRHIVTRRSLFRSNSKRRQGRKSRQKGTQLSFRKPTSESCSEWFHTDNAYFSDSTNFNHKTAGMTNPALHIAVDNAIVMQVSAKTSTENTSSDPKSRRDDDGWWPESLPMKREQSPLSEKCNLGWRLCQYQRQVGQGRACYEAVRDQILSWEFETPTMGIVEVVPKKQSGSFGQRQSRPCNRIPRQETNPRGGFDIVHSGTCEDDDTNPHTWRSTASALCVGGGTRRLATYYQCFPFLGWGFGRTLSSALWCTNPVQVAYELIDQRGPSTTYTSSAYATLNGHWLAGEERITVALRDEDGQVQVQLVSYSKPKTIWTTLTWPLVRRMQNRFFETQLQCIQNVATSAMMTQPLRDDNQSMTLPRLLSNPL